MGTLLLSSVCALKFHCMICSSQSCNAQSTPSIETSHSGLGLDPDNECKKILQLCKKKFSEKVQQRATMNFD